MINKNELRRLARLHRLARQIAASLPADVDRAQALQVNEHAHRLLEWQHDGTPRPENASI
jgi:hypothetical protein